ncbi:YfcC family protein [Cyclobacterium amurskyense]|uniref:YfcC family protein n=1 Tax=Cyclobacterium amurskyense TaxID=320787 RepID=UPI0030DDBA2D|tara:strand:- start:4226 stop:5557 length:1332 start_codon:yes stop_codon:yes gene_type:complete
MKNFPNAFVIILAVIVFSWALTFIIPQGIYDREINAATGLEEVVNNSYKVIEGENLSVFDLLLAIPRGIIGRADIIVLILLLGGCFYVIEKTGALSQGLAKLVALLKGRELLALIIVSAFFTAGGATIGLQEEVIALTPMLLLFGRSLGYNTYTTLYMSYGSSVLGSSFSPSNPFAVMIAQKVAGLPLLSGSGLRLIFLGIAFTIWILFIIRYSRKNPIAIVASDLNEKISNRSKIILILLALTFGAVTYGLLSHGWGFEELAACFFALGILAGLIGKLGTNQTGEAYVAGFKEMIFASVIIGLANSITIVLEQGLIIDSIVYGLFGPLKNIQPTFSAVLMMLSHMVLHLPIPSYSGQAILTMPILVPLSDLIGLSRQTCVLAYQYGSVMADLIVPTNGTLMAVLAISGISYNKWLKFAVKPMILMMILAAISIIFAVTTGYQ